MDIRIEWRPDPPRPDAHADTRWSLVLAAGGRRAGSALAELGARYWGAAYAYIRRCGAPPAMAHDLTRRFFAHLAQDALRGVRRAQGARFRDFLLARLAEAHAERWREVRRTAADASLAPPWPVEIVEDRYLAEVGDHDPPQAAFARGWSNALVARCFERLREEAIARDRLAMYERLLPYLGGEPCADDAAVAAASGMTPAAAAFALRALRQRLRGILAEEATDTVADPADAAGEASVARLDGAPRRAG